MNDTAITKILKELQKENLSAQELSTKLGIPIGTARSTLSLLRQTDLVTPVESLKRGKPFKLTEKGRKRLEELINEN